MKRIGNIIRLVGTTLPLGLALSSCIYDREYDNVTPEDALPGTVRVNTLAVDGAAEAAEEDRDNTFTLLFWMDRPHLTPAENKGMPWPDPYLVAHTPQPVMFYQKSVFDTRYPYPVPDDTYLYATGYAPGNTLKPVEEKGFEQLAVLFDDPTTTARHDFLGCDAWPDVYKGSQRDPFAQEKNKLYFRHLASKLVFYADRDEETMENKQYVRNVKVRHLYMSSDGGMNWIPLHTPSVFEWQTLSDEEGNSDFTASYEKAIAAVLATKGNDVAPAAGTRPVAGYKVLRSVPFSGGDGDFVIDKQASDRVPISGMVIDSCYVCNPQIPGADVAGAPIMLKMDISAEMSFDPNFSMSDSEGELTDNLTFTREWKGQVLPAISQVDASGAVQSTAVVDFKPGCEYRVYIHFYRTGVSLVAKELPWNYGGIHYITIPGTEKQR